MENIFSHKPLDGSLFSCYRIDVSLLSVEIERECDLNHTTQPCMERKPVLKGRMSLEVRVSPDAFLASLALDQPPRVLSPALAALWWDAKGNWNLAHGLIDALEAPDAMAVHAYLHRKEGEEWNAYYGYRRAGESFRGLPFKPSEMCW